MKKIYLVLTFNIFQDIIQLIQLLLVNKKVRNNLYKLYINDRKDTSLLKLEKKSLINITNS